MRILVTGGSGFVGLALVPRLIADGHEIIVTSRDATASVAGATVRQIGELGPETDWSEALEGIEAVIHLAARVHVMNETASDPLGENRRTNTQGTARLASDAARVGVRHFIFLSTIKVNGEATGPSPFHATDVPAPQDPYAIAKQEAEQALLGIAAKEEMRVVIVRPPLIYGPGVRGNFLSLLGLCQKAWPLPFGGIENSRSLIFVGNLADLISRLIEKTKASGVYLCRDGEDLSTPELLRRVAKALGRNPVILPVPGFLLRPAGILTGKSTAISRLTESLAVDDGPTRRDLDWTPPFSMLQGLKETAAWFSNRERQ
jgi:nucleoside-diphosphate-sugar epimerase